MKDSKNCSRDLFRFIRSPADLVYVTCPVRAQPHDDKIIDDSLAMIDPHEYLEYLWCNNKIKVSEDVIRKLGPTSQNDLFFYIQGPPI